MTTRAKTLVTFVDDDGNEEVWTVLKDLYEAQGEPFCISLIPGQLDETGYITTAQAVSLQNNASVDVEVLAHGDTDITTLNEAQMRTEFSGVKAALEAKALNVESYVFPLNSSNELSEATVEDYYRSAQAVGSSLVNAPPLDYFNLRRRQIDTDVPLATLTGVVDDAISDRGWAIFYTHGYDLDAAVQAKLNSLIDYVQAADVPIVTVSQALDQLDNEEVGLISLRGTPQAGNGFNGDDVTLTFDVAPQEGDVVIVFGGHGDAVTTLDAPGSGYTEVFSNTGTKPICGVWYKAMGATPDTEVVCSGGGSALDGAAYASIVLSGVDTANVLDAAATTDSGSSPAQPDSPAITTVTDGALVLSIGLNSANDTSVTGPIGYSSVFGASANDSNDFSTYGAYLEIANASEEDPSGFSTWNPDEWYAITMAIRPLVAVPDVVGETQAQATTDITNAGFTLGTVTQAYSDSVAAGLVISQSPAAGSMESSGSSVDIVVSLGAELSDATGGWLNTYNAYQQRKAAQEKARKEILQKVRELDGIDGEIAELMQLDQAREDEDKRIAEFRALLETEISKAELDKAGLLNKRINRAYDRAMKKATFSAIAALEREIEDAIEEEEFAFLVLTLN